MANEAEAKTEAKPQQGAPTPPFAREFPADPELAALVDAFVAGNYARVRSDAPKLAARTEDPRVRDAARELVARTGADPLAKALLALTAALLIILSAWWIAHNGPR
jgi:hypothetical protein